MSGGKADIAVDEREIPYLSSPASRHARRERVVSWSARKQRDVKKVPRYQALPEWLVRGTEPVPLSDAFRGQWKEEMDRRPDFEGPRGIA